MENNATEIGQSSNKTTKAAPKTGSRAIHPSTILLLIFLLWGTVSLYAQQKAMPKAGEGISAFLLRHNRSPKKYYADFVELNKKRLGKNHTLQKGVAYVIPPVRKGAAPHRDSQAERQPATTKRVGTTLHEPLFGKRLSNVKVSSNRLAGTCFYVVSGHGGPDPGAIGRVAGHELHEDEYAYDIALRIARCLMEEGAEVRIIIQDEKDGIREEAYLDNSKRETCMGKPIPLNQVERLRQRCNAINACYQKDRKVYKYCRAIFIHIDSRGRGKQTDVFFYHSGHKVESKRLANNMKDLFESKYDKHQPNRGFSGTASERNLYVLANTTPSAVFVELGNIQNASDQRRLIMSSNRQALAKWLMEGFLKDFKQKK